jgi:hypothetical protein
MSITFNTDQIDGLTGTSITGIYGRIQSVTVKKYDASGSYTLDDDGNPTDTLNTDATDYQAIQWRCLYDVVLHSSAGVRGAKGESPEWGNRVRSRRIDHFTCTYDPTSNSNPYAQAYADLKTKLAADDPPIATSIADA